MKHVIVLFLALCQPLFPMHKTWLRNQALGVQTFHYHDSARDRQIVVECWYPAIKQGAAEAPLPDPLWVHPQEFRNAALRKREGKYPLILMSHGYRGGRRDLSWLAEVLVKQGYIVAAVDHKGSGRDEFDLAASLRFWDRPKDITFMLDCLSTEPAFQNAIDLHRVGFVGYSLGGMTGLALGGAKAENVRSIVSKVHRDVQEITPEMLDRFDFSQAEQFYGDSRIRALLLLCPATYVYSGEALKQIAVPVGMVAAIGDEVLPFQEHALRLIQHVILKKIKVVRKEISHSAFLNRLSSSGKKIYTEEHPCCPRSSIHREVGGFAIDFFKETLGSIP